MHGKTSEGSIPQPAGARKRPERGWIFYPYEAGMRANGRGDGVMSKEEAWHRRHAVQLASQLPDNPEDAALIIAAVRRLLDGFKDLDELNGRRVLYRWPDLVKYPDATVFFNEGEKDADWLKVFRIFTRCRSRGPGFSWGN
jgi:hypothetical protein